MITRNKWIGAALEEAKVGTKLLARAQLERNLNYWENRRVVSDWSRIPQEIEEAKETLEIFDRGEYSDPKISNALDARAIEKIFGGWGE